MPLWGYLLLCISDKIVPCSFSPPSILLLQKVCATAKSLQSCLTLCDPIDGSPPGSPILGILQAITLEWVAISFSNAWKWKVKLKSLSRVWLLATPWTAAYQAPPPMGFSRQEYWSGVPLPSPKKYMGLEQFLSLGWACWGRLRKPATCSFSAPVHPT